MNCRLAANCQLHIEQNHLKTQEINTLSYFIGLIASTFVVHYVNNIKIAFKKPRFIETIKTSLL